MPARLLELAQRAGVRARVELLASETNIAALIEHALAGGATTFVAGGGDGTVSSVAACLVDGQSRLGVLPLGTLNHFAKDLGLPIDAESAMAVVLGDRVAQVDVGEVNGRIFLNNSSIGLYPRMVRYRQRVQAHGWRKWLVAAQAMSAVLRHRHDLAVRLHAEGDTIARRTSLVFIGNNEYRMQGLDPGARDSLSKGVLSLYVLRVRGWTGVLRAVWQVVTGRVEQGDATDAYCVEDVTIELGGPRVEVALDGEVVPMSTPLRYRIRPGALRVLVPPGS